MPRVQLVVSDEEKELFVNQARLQRATLSDWLRRAALAYVPYRDRHRRFESEEEIEAFFRACDEIAGPDREPDWEEHLAVLNESKLSGLADA